LRSIEQEDVGAKSVVREMWFGGVMWRRDEEGGEVDLKRCGAGVAGRKSRAE
jgi:hypothetical protein